MRPDIGKVITERPRRGMRYKKPKDRHDYDISETAAKGEKIRLKWTKSWNGKEFTDLIGPLKGFLKSRCGKPWAKVCSEISAVLPAKGGVSLSHARDHLFQMVEQKTQIIDGVVCDSKGESLGGYPEFYVDPKGFLRKNKNHRFGWYRSPKPRVFQKTEDGEWLIEDSDGRWWACSMAPYESNGSVPSPNPRNSSFLCGPTYPVVWDSYLKKRIHSPGDLRLYAELPYDGGKFYCARKRQLGKREIKKYGLRKEGG